MKKETDRRVFDLMDYWLVVVRRKNILFIFCGVLIVLVGIYSFSVSPKYKPTATILIGEQKSKMMNVEDEFGFVGYRNQLQDVVYINTQLTLLKSISLAQRVVDKMDLLKHPQFGAADESKKSIGKKIKDLVTFKWLKSKGKTKEGQQPLEDPALEIAEKLQENIAVSPIRETNIIKITYTSKDPVLGTQIVNTLADEFINYSIDVRFKTTQQARDFLSEQISLLRDELSAKEMELQRYSQEKDLLFLSDTESAALSEYSELHRAFAQAQVDRINAQATYRELRSLDIDSPIQMVDNRVIQDLTTEYSRMKNDFEELSKVYGPNHPDMIKRRASLDSMKVNLQDEVQKAVSVAETEYRSALRKENDLKAALTGQEVEVAKLNSDKILYNSIKIESENIRGQLNSLEQMRKEAEVSTQLVGLKTSNITIVDYARVPESPASPKKKMNMLLALFMGLSGGIALCFIVDFLDNTIKNADEVEKLVGLPSLGMIPLLSLDGAGDRGIDSTFQTTVSGMGGNHSDVISEVKKIELINHHYPNLLISEDYRTVRTSILLSHADQPPKVIAFSSSLPQEGKTATVANMAVAFAQLGKKVVIIDADLRRPRLHRLFDVKNTHGLSGFLTGKSPLDSIVQKTSVENVWLIPSGPVPPNPAELLESGRMKILLDSIQKELDMILIDTPPVLAVVDTLIIGALVGNIVLIAQPEKTNRKAFIGSVEKLGQSNAKILGIIFNKTAPRTKQYYDKYYYYQHYYSPDRL